MTAVTYLEAIGQAIREEMRRDEAVFLLGEDVGDYGGAFKVSAGLLEEFGPERVIDTPMAEAAIIGSAVGAALMVCVPSPRCSSSTSLPAALTRSSTWPARCTGAWVCLFP